MSFRRFVKLFIPKKLFKKIEPFGHLFEAILFNTLYGFPARKLKVIGVTGTNGKTTTCFLIHRMLHEAGYKVGLMTTVAYGAGDNIHSQTYHMTNVTMPALMKRLRELKKEGIEWLVLETTSQGLAQNRLWGIQFHLAVMTNVTHEHLDWHGTFENYRDSKRLLFKRCNRHKRGTQTGIINAEDSSASLFASDVQKSILYGVKKGKLRAKNVKTTPSGSTYTAEISNIKYQIQCNLPGSFNVYNSLAAVGAGHVLGLKTEHIEKGIEALKNVEGRMTTIDEGQDFEVIVDYAHTPDSFEKLFKDIRKIMDSSRASHLDTAQGSKEEQESRRAATANERETPADTALRQEPASVASSAGQRAKAGGGSGKLIIMFGSAGRRDEAKRPVQGELAGKYGDELVITEEDDRDIDGQQIMDEIATGAEKAGKVREKDLFLVHDRTEAIKFAISRANATDTVLLLGKGHEKTIERVDGERPWDEIATAHQALQALLNK